MHQVAGGIYLPADAFATRRFARWLTFGIVSVCHTDLHAMLGDWPFPSKLPLIGGHEGSGMSKISIEP